MADPYIRFRRLHWTDTSGNRKRCSALASQAVADDADDDWSSAVDADNYEVLSATPHTSGTGYEVGDVLTAAGGTGSLRATFSVAAIRTGGAIAGITLLARGNYTAAPATLNAVSGGHGNSATLDLVIGAFRDLYIGGGGPVLMTVVGVLDFDDIICRPDDAPSDGSKDVIVAFPFELQNCIRTEIIDGETWDYGDTYTVSITGPLAANTATTHSRIATRGSDSAVEYQVITPRIVGGQKVSVEPCSNTGIVLSGGAPVKFICRSCRAWAKQYSA